MKKYILLMAILLQYCLGNAQTADLKGVTFGLGLGYSHLFTAPKEYYLTTDATHKLQVQNLDKSGVVLSSVITIKLSKVAVQSQTSGTRTQNVLVNANRTRTLSRKPGELSATATEPTYDKLKFSERLAVNLSLNLADVNSGNVSFNKYIDGGIGLGCYINEFTQVALMYEMQRLRQMRTKIVETYEGKSIPNGNEVLNALDEKDNNLFYNKYYSGVAIKVVFSLGNK
ncbi:hypothetical protein [Ferruginibacter sp.]|nr:hypothetical protein [Ferruginibacter sp.]